MCTDSPPPPLIQSLCEAASIKNNYHMFFFTAEPEKDAVDVEAATIRE